jgi:hypothetical protein
MSVRESLGNLRTKVGFHYCTKHWPLSVNELMRVNENTFKVVRISVLIELVLQSI